MSLIKSIIIVVDNDPSLLNLFLDIASQATTPWELGESYKQVLRSYLEFEYITVATGVEAVPYGDSFDHLVSLYQEILSQSINSIPEADWQTLAAHYLNKAAQS